MYSSSRLWCNQQHLLEVATEPSPNPAQLEKRLHRNERRADAGPAERLADGVKKIAPAIRVTYENIPEEKHATINHPAALNAFRGLFGPEPTP